MFWIPNNFCKLFNLQLFTTKRVVSIVHNWFSSICNIKWFADKPEVVRQHIDCVVTWFLWYPTWLLPLTGGDCHKQLIWLPRFHRLVSVTPELYSQSEMILSESNCNGKTHNFCLYWWMKGGQFITLVVQVKIKYHNVCVNTDAYSTSSTDCL